MRQGQEMGLNSEYNKDRWAQWMEITKRLPRHTCDHTGICMHIKVGEFLLNDFRGFSLKGGQGDQISPGGLWGLRNLDRHRG